MWLVERPETRHESALIYCHQQSRSLPAAVFHYTRILSRFPHIIVPVLVLHTVRPDNTTRPPHYTHYRSARGPG